jgi:hemoglobin-like flavoprotein
MIDEIRYTSIAKVLESWEISRQKLGCVEEVGAMILLHLFERSPETKAIFGLQIDGKENIQDNPILRNHVLVHGTAMFKFLDGVLNLLGPDIDMIVQVMAGLGKRHQRLGVKKEHFPLLGLAIRNTLEDIMKENWTKTLEDAWIEVFDELSLIITNDMV